MRRPLIGLSVDILLNHNGLEVAKCARLDSSGPSISKAPTERLEEASNAHACKIFENSHKAVELFLKFGHQ